MSKDPYYKREQEKYDDPIPSREYIVDVIRSNQQSMSREQIQRALKISQEHHVEALRRRLNAMVRDVDLVLDKEQFELPERLDLVLGKVIGHKDGMGFLRPDDGSDDWLISHRCMRRYFHDDQVLAQPIGFNHRGRAECRIIKLMAARSPQIIGTVRIKHDVCCVIPKDKRIQHWIEIPEAARNQAEADQVVVVEIITRPAYQRKAQGRILEILDQEDQVGMEIQIALRNYDLPHAWSSQVAKQVHQFPDHVTSDECVDRVDLRHLPLVTIDDEDSRDFDDAVYAEPLADGTYKLLVAIADVSHYVKKDSLLDQEALARGNSVYFPSQVLPMLPEALSNGLCSLNERVDRLCMACEMVINTAGELIKYQFYPAVMHSHKRLTYTKVAHFLTTGELEADSEFLQPHLLHLQAIYGLLSQAREQRGAIGFETQEMKFVFGQDARIQTIVPRVRNEAHKIIEECMIAANVAAARFVLANKGETLYRVHESPSEEKLMAFHSLLAEKGISITKPDEPHPKVYAKLMKQIAERPDRAQIQILLLRSMKQARYTAANEGHFGLALEQYAHFTSPIRRYPDLQLHREIRYLLARTKGKLKEKWTPDGGYLYDAEELDSLGLHCSMTERRADDATREVSDWLKCEYMQQYVGQEFDAQIVSLTSFGFFARLNDWFIDGLVHITSLTDDFYQFDSERQHLLGEHTRRCFKITDKVRIRVAHVNLEDKQIDFVLHDMAPPKGQPVGKRAPMKKAPASAKKSKSKSSRKRNQGENKVKKSTKPKGKPSGKATIKGKKQSGAMKNSKLSTREKLKKGQLGSS
jgi:ribonuclease R